MTTYIQQVLQEELDSLNEAIEECQDELIQLDRERKRVQDLLFQLNAKQAELTKFLARPTV